MKERLNLRLLAARSGQPLRAARLRLLVRRRVCAVVFDSDVCINYGPPTRNLKGATLGVVAFEVLSVTQPIGHGSSALPKCT